MQVKVMFTEREVPPNFPGETGTLGFMRICPPMDHGDFRFLPQIHVAHWPWAIPDIVGPALPYAPFEGPAIDQLPMDLDGSKMIGSALVWRHLGSEETVLAVLRGHDGSVIMGVSFTGSILRFRLRTLEVTLDCGWATGVEGLALCRWEPGQISLSYFAPTLDGTCEMRSATSDTCAVESRAVLAMPGDELDTLLRAANSQTSPPTISFGIAICLLSSRPLSLVAKQDIARRYGEALRELIAIEGVEGSQIVGVPIYVRNQLIDGELFERWRQAVGYPPGWGGEAWSILVSAESPREVIEEIQDLQAYASMTNIMRIAEVDDELIPPPRMVGRIPSDVLWHHVARGRILDDEKSWALRDAVQAKVWEVGRRMVLQCAHLLPLYDMIGTEWLEEQSAKARQRLAAKQVSPNMLLDVPPAVLGWIWLREDVILDDSSLHDEKVRAWGWLTQLVTDLNSIGVRIPPQVRGELLNRLRTDGYRQAAFEVKVAALLLESGSEPVFVPPGQKRSPDLHVERDGLHYFVECCHKDPNSKEVDRAMNLAQQLAAITLGREARGKRSTLVTISLKELLTPEVFAETRKLLDEVGASGVLETESVRVTARPLGDWGAVYDPADLAGRVRDQWDLVYVGGSRMAFWPMDRITYASVVGIEMQRERDLLKSLERTLEDKGAWQSHGGQIPDNSLGVLALGVGDCTRATVLRLAPLLKNKMERSHEAVSVLLLIWDEREHENNLTSMVRTYCVPIVNTRAIQQWPESAPLPVGEVRGVGLTSKLGPAVRSRDEVAAVEQTRPGKRM